MVCYHMLGKISKNRMKLSYLSIFFWLYFINLFSSFLQYLEELMGPILFSWVACGVSLFAFVQVNIELIFYLSNLAGDVLISYVVLVCWEHL